MAKHRGLWVGRTPAVGGRSVLLGWKGRRSHGMRVTAGAALAATLVGPLRIAYAIPVPPPARQERGTAQGPASTANLPTEDRSDELGACAPRMYSLRSTSVEAMNTAIRDELMRELVSRGFKSDGASPNGTMVLDAIYLGEIDIAELLEIMVARREKVFRSQDVVGPESAKASYEDVVRLVESINAVIGRHA